MAWSWSADRRGCRRSRKPSPIFSGSRRSTISIRTRSWRSAPRSRPTSLAGNRAAGRRLAAARRHPAVARARDDGRACREDRSAQLDDPGDARAGVHDVQGRPDGDRDPRRAGRTREGGGLPVARALRAARHSADAGRRGAGQGHVPGRRRRPAVGFGARADVGRRGVDRRASRRMDCRTPRSRGCCRNRSRMPRTTWPRARSPRRRSRPTSSSRRRAPRSPRTAISSRRRRARAIDDAIADVLRQRDGGDRRRRCVAAIDALNRATGEFAAQRMDRGVARALTGRNIDALT